MEEVKINGKIIKEDPAEWYGPNARTLTIEKACEDIVRGDEFDSPRKSEGRVIAVCDYGNCDDDRRPNSIHVRQIALSKDDPWTASEFFIPMMRDRVTVEHFVRDIRDCVLVGLEVTIAPTEGG